MKTKKKRSIARLVVPLVILLNVAFTLLAVYVQVKTMMELSSTLITCWFGFTTGELWMLSSIKKSKLKNNYNPTDSTECESDDFTSDGEDDTLGGDM